MNAPMDASLRPSTRAWYAYADMPRIAKSTIDFTERRSSSALQSSLRS